MRIRRNVVPLLVLSAALAVGYALSIQAQDSTRLTVGNYRLISKKSAKQGLFDFTYAADITNAGGSVRGVTATLTTLSPVATVIEGSLTFGDVPGGAVVASQDTFTIRHANRDMFDPAWLSWAVTGTSANRAPTAVIAPLTAPVLVGQTLALDGSASSDPDGDVLTFVWVLVAKPAGSTASLTGGSATTPLLIDRPGTYQVRLDVSDGQFSASSTPLVFTTSNSPPVANAGPDQTAPVQTTVTLTGSGSSDVDGDVLTYVWTLVQRPAGSTTTLNDSSSLAPTLFIDRAGTFIIQLVVTDVNGTASAPDLVEVDTLNSAPVANAGPDQTVPRDSLVTLDGSGSTDVDGDALTYLWEFLSKPDGSGATLSDPAAIRPTFSADRRGNFVLRLTVSDGARVNSDTVQVTTENTAPVARAGADRSLPVGTTVTLDGSGSTDVDGDLLTYSWSLTGVPEGSAATLSDATAIMPTFTIDKPGDYVAQLTVHDGTVFSAPDVVVISTVNSAPVANAGPDRSFVAGQVVTLDGSGSMDIDGAALTYQWSLIGRPDGSTATLANASSVNPSFTADRPGTFTAQLIVSDGVLQSSPDTVVITSTNTSPVANAGADQIERPAGQSVALDGSGSSDADGHSLTHAWALIGRPGTSSATLANPNDVAPTFIPDVAGEYVAQLIVNDGFVDSAPDTVMISVTGPAVNEKPIANAGDDQSADAPGTTVRLDGRGSNDPEGSPLTYSWEFISRPAGSAATLSDPASAQPTFVVDLPGLYVVQLIVNDGVQQSDPDQVSVNGNAPPVAKPGPTQVVVEGALVQLDGSASFDPDPNYPRSCPADAAHPNELRWQWILNTRPAESTACLKAPGSETCLASELGSVVNPVFVADKPGVYVAQLVVNDCIVNGESALVQVRTFNSTPIANAGQDQMDVPQDAIVTLDGSQSFDPDDGDDLQYQWSFVERPVGSTALLLNPSTIRPTFTVDVLGRYVAQLVVTDPFGASSVADTVVIRTPNRAPTADAGQDRVGTVNTSMSVSGSGSDPDGDPLSYSWTLFSKPSGSTTTLTGGSNATAVFTPDVAGQYVLRLVVSDGALASTSDEVIVNVTTGNIVLALANPGLMGVGRQNVLLISLTAPAPTGGVTVGVASDAPGVVSVSGPNSVSIAAGASQAQVTLEAISPGVTFVRASAPSYLEGSLNVSVTSRLITLPASVSAAVGITSAIPLSIAPDPAPAGGVSIQVVSSDPTRIEVLTPTVTIPAGAFSANASVRGLAGGVVTLLATHAEYATAAMQVTSTGSLNILENSVTMTPGFPGSIRVQLESNGSPIIVPQPGLTVALTAANSGCLSIPASVTIPAGQTFVQFPLAHGGAPSLPCTTSITAGATGLTSDSISVTVNPNPGITIAAPSGSCGGSFPRYVGAGLQDGNYSFTLGASNHGGVTVRITSSDPTLALVAPNATTPGTEFIDVAVANGSTSGMFYVQGLAGRVGTVTLAAAAPGFTERTSGIVNIVTPAVSFMGSLTASTTALSTDLAFRAFVGPPADNGAELRNQSCNFLAQAVRAGGDPLTVTVISSSPSVGLIKTLSGAAASGTATIAVGQNATESSIAAGGLAFDPVAEGSTTISASIPGFIATTAASRAVTVTVPTITISAPSGICSGSFPRYVGAGLQDGNYSVGLAASNHGGVTMRVTTSDPTIALVAPNATTPGTEFIDVTVANGSNSATFYVQGVEGRVGAVSIMAAAPGFSSTTSGIINVVAPAVSLTNSLTTNTTALSTDSTFRVFVGPPSPAGEELRNQGCMTLPQAVRAGGSELTVTVTSSTPSVGLIKTLAGAAPSGTATIAVGQSATAASVAAGGFAFDPVAGGSTAVSASIPGFMPMTAASRAVTVTAPTISFTAPSGICGGSFPRYVGAGLQEGNYSVGLAATNHGGVTVRITSSDPTVALIAPNATTPGTEFIDVAVGNGSSSATFYVQGVEGRSGAVTVTAAAPGFTLGTSGTVNIVTPAVSLVSSLAASTTALSTDSVFRAFVGPPSPGGEDLRNQSCMTFPQSVRAGGSPLTVTVTSSTPSVGLVKTLSGAAASVAATIAVGQNATAASIAAGGLAFDPIAGGSTTVSASIPGFIATTAASRTVTVSAPGISLNAPSAICGGSFPRYIGAGLQDGSYGFGLGASNHGGVTVRITSSDPTVALVAPTASTPGTEFIDVAVANGSTSGSFYVQGLEGRAGSLTITAAAPGFTGTTSGIINVVTPGFSLLGSLIGSTTAMSPDSPFRVSVGPPAADGADLRVQSCTTLAQAVRAGGSPLTVTVTSSAPSVALVKALSGAAASVTSTIAVGQNSTPSTVASGGVAFDPMASGTAAISASIPGVIATSAASRTVTVTTANITVTSPGGAARYVGAGLQDGAYSFSLGGSSHGGVTVRIVSSDPTRLQVAPNASTAGAEYIDIPIADGTTNGTFYVQGVEGQSGAVTVAASAPGFNPGTSGTITVVPAAYRLTNLPTSVAATGATTTFFVEVGVAAAGDADLLNQSGTGTGQAVRPGSILTATVTNSNGIGAQLVTASGGDQSWAVNILAGQSRTASSTGTGGIAFDPLSGACSQVGCDTLVDVVIPGLVKVVTATRTVRITP